MRNQINVSPYSWAGIGKNRRRDIRTNVTVYRSFYDRYKTGKMVYNKYIDKSTVGFDYCERKIKAISDNVNLYLEQLLKFVTIYKLGDVNKYEEVIGKNRKKEIVEVRRLFIDACFNQNNVNLSTLLLGAFLNRDHSTIIHNRNLQDDYKFMYRAERRQSDYILTFANQSIVFVNSFIFDEESTHSIKSGAWAKR